MGCASSKLDDLAAVALCRERISFLDQAIRQRYALAEAHVAYAQSLRGVGQSLHQFITYHNAHSIEVPDSPKLNLPPRRKGDADHGHGDSPKKGKIVHRHSGSGSGSGSAGSHLRFNSDSEDEEGSDSLHHSDHYSPLTQHHLGMGPRHGPPMEYPDPGFFRYPNMEPMGPYSGGFMHMNYMKRHATPSSVVYEQTPMSSERVYIGESSSSSSSYYPYPYPPSNYPPYIYPGNPSFGGGGGSISGYYGSPPQPESRSKPPPPPPPPAEASAWDFLNPFENYERFYPPSTPSRERELREEEGIPDLEDEDFNEHVVVKEVHGDQKFAGKGNHQRAPAEEAESSKSGSAGTTDAAEACLYQARPSVSGENDRMEYEVHVVDKKVVADERSDERRSNAAGRGGPMDASELARDIEVQFGRAADSGNEIAQILEVEKLPYQRKHVSSKTSYVVTPSLSVFSSQPSTSRSSETSSSADPAALDFEREVALSSRKLSSTLHKLYLWEKKLYNEVKAEEKMRVLHDRKVRKLKRLHEKGAEASKVEPTRTLVRSLSTKIRIAIQVVDKISVTINRIRDEELWPLLNELIHGLTRMWKSMLDCHHSQYQAIREARGLGPIRSGKKLSDAHLEATRQLEHELINWTMRFSNWVGAQKGYVKALNNWLEKCLLIEPEETVDGIAPFSPSRMGAPPIFVICNQWSKAMDRISETEVINSMRTFTLSVLQLWEQDKTEMRQRMIENKDLEKKVRNLDKEDQKIQKEVQALQKKMVPASGDGSSLSLSGHLVYQIDTGSNSLQRILQRIFEAMERFMADSMKEYEGLLHCVEEELHAEDSDGSL